MTDILNYYDVYLARVTKHGATHKEREYNYGIANFEKFLRESPSAEEVLINGTPFMASIASNKQDQYKLTKEILTTLTTPIEPGSLVKWKDAYWLVFQKELQPNQAYNSCFMTRCNHLLKWIDVYGVERKTWAYVLSSKDSQVKQNFRTWNRLITAQPNQYIEMLTPTQDSIILGQKFIIDDRAWFVTEYDKTSCEGLDYYSLVEDMYDRMDDDKQLGLANIKDLGLYHIECDDITIALNTSYSLAPLVYKGEELIENEKLGYKIDDQIVAEVLYDGGDPMVVPYVTGTTTLTIFLIDQPRVRKKINVTVTENETITTYSLVGDSSIKTTDTKVYRIIKTTNTNEYLPITSFAIDDETLATGHIENGTDLIITANDDNKLGIFILSVTSNESVFTKQIVVRSLWSR